MARKEKRKFENDNGFGDWGGYMAAKISKLENQYAVESREEQYSAKISNIFSNVAIFVNGYTTPTAEELKRLMQAHGGTYHHYYNSKTTTHIIASNLCDAKIKKLKGDEKFVKPEWITDSIQAQTLLDFKPYLLYTGPILDKGQRKLELVPNPNKNNQEDKKSVGNTEVVENAGPVSESSSREMKRAGEDDFLSEFYKRSRLHHISTMGAMFKRHVAQLRSDSNGIFPGLQKLDEWKQKNDCLGSYEHDDEPVFMHIDMDCFFVSVGLRNHPDLVGKPVVVTHGRADSKPLPRREGCNREFEFDCYKEHWIKKSKFADNSNSSESAAVSTNIFPRLKDLDETCSMSEIASCNYEARAFGIYNGMFMGGALKLCPSLVAIPYDFDGYKEVSTTLYNTIASYTLDMEAVSCDELYADITMVLKQSGLSPCEFACHVKEVISAETKCNASVGMGPNMLMARLATKKAKPNGKFYISKKDMNEFMKNHKVEDLPGVGRSMAHRLHAMGAHTCSEMQQLTLGKLQHEFGAKQGQTLYSLCRGEDKRTLKTDHIRKSISADVNYGVRFANDQEMQKFVQELSTEVSKRMEEIAVKGRQLTLKLKVRAKDAPVETAKFMGHGVCDSISRSTVLAIATRDSNTIAKEALGLLRQLKVDSCELRGMGIQLSKLLQDNPTKGKDPMQNSLLKFMSRGKTTPLENSSTAAQLPENFESDEDGERPSDDTLLDRNLVSGSVTKGKQPKQNAILSFLSRKEASTSIVTPTTSRQTSPIPTTSRSMEDERSRPENSLFDLPSASQIDSAIFNELPDDLKKDIIQEYHRKGITLNGIDGITSCLPVQPPETLTSGPSTSSNSRGVSKINKAVSYDEIEEIADIDASYWSALPDDIKVEIERDIQQRKAAASPNKVWKNIFKQRSPAKSSNNKPNKKKVKVQETTTKVPSIVKLQQPAETRALKCAGNIESSESVLKEEITLCGASTLPEIRQLLTEWLSSTEDPENEDCEAVSRFLVQLVHNKELHKIEPIILFLKRKVMDKNDSWKRVVDDIVNHTQLYVIQHYNAPLKLPSSSTTCN